MSWQVQSAVRAVGASGQMKTGQFARHKVVQPAKICIVEDDDDIREALEDLLGSVGYQAKAYDRADQALAELEEQAPDLILLDLMMPGMNGWQFRVAQRKRPRVRDIPVIVLSADVSPYAEAVDADAYLAKPIDFDELQATLQQVLLTHERRELVDKSVELERIRSLGMLTASVAHEINNPLSYLIGSLDLAQRQAEALSQAQLGRAQEFADLRENISAAVDGADRVATIVTLLSTFSRADDAETESVDAVRAVQAAARLALHRIAPRAQLVTALTPVPPVIGNEARLAQVVLNLLVNAAQAIPMSAEGEHQIRVSTRADGEAVLIEVTDDGVGMTPEVLDKIFQPFFTTKAPGEGTGLGLSISRDIISSMGGHIEATSRPGEGTTFRIRLPIRGEGANTDEHGRGDLAEKRAAPPSERPKASVRHALKLWKAFGGSAAPKA